MASLFSGSLNPTSDLPKPETDLAEWTNKIKALQKQVDADDEAQQKRLEDEIVEARRARLRRRSGLDGSHVNSLDISNPKEDLNLHISVNDNVPDYPDNSGVERKIDRDTALRKLMGSNNVYNPDKTSTPVRATEPTSLAAFIGGRASGPRLNRHAPQQDAHDPTQFVQPDTSRPHPIFGRGGIAMPGMADIKDSNTYGSNAGSESSERYRPSLTAKPKPKSPSPPAVNASSKMETSNRSSVDITRLSLTGPSESKVAERYIAKVEDRPVHLGTEIPQSNFPSFRTTKSTFSAPSSPFTRKDTGQEQESYLRSSTSSNKLANRSLSNIPNLTSALPPQVSVSTSAGPLKFGSSNKSDDTSTSTIATTPKSTSPLVGAQSSVKPLTTRSKSTERTRDAPLRKLMEINNIHNPDTGAAQASQKSEASSLAAFIGGRATGPRLNRHAPQQDVHDPTQFVQPGLSAPHPIFGKGGIAMPGMMTKPVESSFSMASKSTTQSVQSRGENAGSRERTTSGSSSKELESFTSVDRRLSPTKGFGATTRDRTISTPSYSRSIGTSHELSRSSVSPTPSRLSNSTLGLAQPIRPDIKVPSILPQIPSTYIPSPAFQKPLSQKDPTPSISRLQGRGFVQSMVKVSAELEISSPTTPSPGKSRPAGGRKNAVLDRWQPNMQADTSPTRPSSSHPDVMRRSTTFNTTNTISDNLNVSTHATGSSRTLKPMASLPSLIQASNSKEIDPPVDESLVPDKPSGLGSASTMVVLKPSKSSGDLGPMPWNEELGMKHNPTNFSRQGSPFSPRSEKATSSRKSLIHPTKIKDLLVLPAVDAQHAPSPSPAETDSSVEVGFKSVLATVNSVALPARTHSFAHHSDVSDERNDLPSMSRSSASLTRSSMEENTELETPQRHASNRGMISPSDNNATEVASLQNDPFEFVSPFLSFAPFVEPPSQSSSSMTLPMNAAVVHSPRRHSRIPSTGNRITVMEVSQSFNDFVNSQNSLESCATSISSVHEPASPVEIALSSRTTRSQIQAEKRNSAYEKYSAITLPPLKEEATPTQTPAGTLTRINAIQRRPSIGEVELERQGDLNEEYSNEDTGSPVVSKTKDMIYLDK